MFLSLYALTIYSPFSQVRHIVTHRRVIGTLVAIYLFSFVTIAPLYVVNRLDLKFYPKRNKTLIGLVSTADREPVDKFLYGLNNVVIPVLLFVVVITCTTFLVIKLHSKAEWRQKSTNSSQADTVSKRNKRVAKMVVMISAIFIACFIPVSITFLGMCLEPGLSVDGTYRNTLVLIGGVCIFCESFNSSVNIFIYYSMSRNYRDIFHQMFHIKNDKCWDSFTKTMCGYFLIGLRLTPKVSMCALVVSQAQIYSHFFMS